MISILWQTFSVLSLDVFQVWLIFRIRKGWFRWKSTALRNDGLFLTLCEVYIMLFGVTDLKLTDFFSLPNRDNIRGHQYRLMQVRTNISARRHFFPIRIVPIWNSLAQSCFEINGRNNVSSFRRKVTSLDRSRYLKGSGLRL